MSQPKDSQTTQEHVKRVRENLDEIQQYLPSGSPLNPLFRIMKSLDAIERALTPPDDLLNTARNEALEEAAKECDERQGGYVWECNVAIRALKTNSPQASGESQAQTASLKQQAEPSDAKERGDDYLRKLAEETAQSIGDIVNSNPRPIRKMEKKILTALQQAYKLGKDSK